MSSPTELHDHDLEEQLRSVLHDRAGTITGPAPSLPTIDAATVAPPSPVGGSRYGGSRRWAAVGIAAAVLAVAAAAYTVTRPEDTTDAVSTAATDPESQQATAGDTRVLVTNGSTWPGEDLLGMMTEALTDLGISQVATETTTDLAQSAVYYRPGFEAIAAQVAFQSYLTGQETPLPAALQDVDADVVVQLGQDWDPFASNEVRGDPSSLPYVPATSSDSLQLAGPPAWPGPGNDQDPADTPVVAVRSFLARAIGVDEAGAAQVEELYQLPLDGFTTAHVRVVLASGEETEARVGRTDGQDRWVLSGMSSTSSSDDPWGGFTGPMPLSAASDAAAVEMHIAYPDGTASARIWYREGDGPTMVVEVDHSVLEAGYQDVLDDYGDGPGPDSPIQLGSDRESLGSVVLLKGSSTENHSYVGVFYGDDGAPITVFADSFYVA